MPTGRRGAARREGQGGGGGGAAAGEEAGDSGARASGLGQRPGRAAQRWSPAGLHRASPEPAAPQTEPLETPSKTPPKGRDLPGREAGAPSEKASGTSGTPPRPPPRPMVPRRPLLQSQERRRSSTEPPKRIPSSGRCSAPSPPSGRQPRRPTVAVPQRPGLRTTTAAGESFAALSSLRFQTSRTKPACRNTLATAPRMNSSIFFMSRGMHSCEMI